MRELTTYNHNLLKEWNQQLKKQLRIMRVCVVVLLIVGFFLGVLYGHS